MQAISSITCCDQLYHMLMITTLWSSRLHFCKIWGEQCARQVYGLTVPHLSLTYPSYGEYGWKEVVIRGCHTGLISKAYRELRCGCKAQPLCPRKRRCHEAGLRCTKLWACDGDCDLQSNHSACLLKCTTEIESFSCCTKLYQGLLCANDNVNYLACGILVHSL